MRGILGFSLRFLRNWDYIGEGKGGEWGKEVGILKGLVGNFVACGDLVSQDNVNKCEELIVGYETFSVFSLCCIQIRLQDEESWCKDQFTFVERWVAIL